MKYLTLLIMVLMTGCASVQTGRDESATSPLSRERAMQLRGRAATPISHQNPVDTKTVRLTFVNTTKKPLDFQLTSSMKGTEHLGMLTPAGGEIEYMANIPTGDLPADFQWKAADMTGKFTITKENANKLWIYVPGLVVIDGVITGN